MISDLDRHPSRFNAGHCRQHTSLLHGRRLHRQAATSKGGMVGGYKLHSCSHLATSGGDHPFLCITTQSSSPQKSTEIVDDAIAAARQRLTDLQNDSNVRPQNQVRLESVVDATPPKAVMNIVYIVTGAALLFVYGRHLLRGLRMGYDRYRRTKTAHSPVCISR